MSGSVQITVALIAALPPTLVAVGAWRASHRTHTEIKTNDGKRAGDYVESSAKAVARLEEQVHLLTARQRALANTSTDGIFETDGRGYYTWVSAGWTALTGLGIDQAMGRGWLAAVHPDDRTMVSDAWDQSISDGRSFGPMKFRLVNSVSVEVTLVHQRASVVHNSDGDINGWVGTVIPMSVLRPA